MTVAELIAELSKHPPHAHVLTRYDTLVERYVVNVVERRWGIVARTARDDNGADDPDGAVLEVCPCASPSEAADWAAADGTDAVDVVVLGTTQDLPDAA